MSDFVAELVRGDGPVRTTGIANPRAGSWIVGGVRLDGREALRHSLGAAGIATAREASDSDLVLAAWTAWRETATERLRGDFSFALWDSSRRTLFCARDALGVCPLYWAVFGDAFVCSNVLDAVLAHTRATRRLHEPAIVSFLRCGYNDDLTTTSFADVRRLAPAHQITFGADSGVTAPRKYWSFPTPEPLRLRQADEYVERFREVLGDAVRDRLRATRAGILLSGGLDSTALAATARRVAPDVALHAWTNDLAPYAPTDEVALASTVATRLGIAHDVLTDKLSPLAHLKAPHFRTPEPLDESEWSMWTRQLALVAANAPVLIVGEDGDALFRPPGLMTTMRAWPVHDVLRRAISYTLATRHRPHLGIWLRRRIAEPFRRRIDRVPAWIRRDALARAGAPPRRPPLEHSLRPDAVRFLSDPVWQSVLEPAQRAYTGVPLDIVWPLLDTRVIEFVFSIPPVPWCQRKELLRRSFRGELPEEIVSRKKSPLRGFFEGQVAVWRVAARQLPRLGEEVRHFVDSESVVGTLQRGSVGDVLAAWRVLILDQWLTSKTR